MPRKKQASAAVPKRKRADDPIAMVKCRVIGRYGPHKIGETVEIERRKLPYYKHALREHGDLSPIEATVPPTDISIYKATRANAEASERAMLQSATMRRKAELEALGLKIVEA